MYQLVQAAGSVALGLAEALDVAGVPTVGWVVPKAVVNAAQVPE